jgi:hypothetical protein
MHDRTREGLDLLERLTDFHRDFTSYAITARRELEDQRLLTPQQVDAAYVLKETAKLAEEVRQQSNVLGELLQKVACAVWMATEGADPESKPVIRGEYAQGKPGARIAANVPARGSEEHRRLMQYLGIPEGARDLVSVKWNRLSEDLEKRAAEGRPLPPGVSADQTYNVYFLGQLRPIPERG